MDRLSAIKTLYTFVGGFLLLCFASCERTATPDTAVAIPKTTEEIWTTISPSLVHVVAQGYDGRGMQGSGFVVELDRKRLILTNRHVVKGAEKVMVGTNAEELLPAPSYKIANDLDLAVVECPSGLNAAPLRLATRPINPGAEVVALGSPLGLSKVITRGIVSSVEETYILFDAPISSGNSGGPVVDRFGDVIGIATMGSKSQSDAVVQNLNIGIRVTAIPSVDLFTEPLLRISAVSGRIRAVEAYVAKGYSENDYFELIEVLRVQWGRRMLQEERPAEWDKVKGSAESALLFREIERKQQKWEGAYGSLRKAVEHYVAFLRKCEEQIDALPAAFTGLGDDAELRDLLKDERRGGWFRIKATPESLPAQARISADHWLAKFEDHRFRLEWAFRYSPDVPFPPRITDLQQLDKGDAERPRIRLRHSVTGDRQSDLQKYIETSRQWSERKDVREDVNKGFLKDDSAEKDPLQIETLHGALLNVVSSFRQYLALEATERGHIEAAIKALQADIGERGAACWSGALLAQNLVYAGRFDEAWRAYERHFANPPPFNAFNLEEGWSNLDGAINLALHDICIDMKLPNTGRVGLPSIIANTQRWNAAIKMVDGRRFSDLRSVKETLSSDWFAALSRLSQIRVLFYFRWLAGANPNEKPEEFEAALATAPQAAKLWKEMAEKRKIEPIF